jgi:hypothetical protein
LVSLHDPDVRPIVKGRLGKPIEFGYPHERSQPTAATAKPPWNPTRRLIKWRTGCEGRISHLKHRYDLVRTRFDGLATARIWCGHGILAHNLTKSPPSPPQTAEIQYPPAIRDPDPHTTRTATHETYFSGRSN